MTCFFIYKKSETVTVSPFLFFWTGLFSETNSRT
jgi:hypothetical protein